MRDGIPAAARQDSTISFPVVRSFEPWGAPGRDDDYGVNLLSALAPTSVPVDPLEWPVQKVQFAAAIKALKVEQDMAKEVVRLLDPNAGTRLNTSA